MVVVRLTRFVVIPNVADETPAGTVIDSGIDAEPSVLSATTAPPDGAAPVSVSVPVDSAPPRTLLGESVSVEITADCGGGGAAPDPSTAKTVPRP